MASTFTAMSCVGSLVSSSGLGGDKKRVSSSDALSSFASISSPLAMPRRNVVLQKKLNSKVQAMAKELHFNRDGSAIKKLQVTIYFEEFVSLSHLSIFLMFSLLHDRQVSTS